MLKFKSLLIFLAVCCFPLISVSQSIKWISLKEAQEKASQNSKMVFIYAEAEWCGYCKKMEEEVFPEKSVVDNLDKYFYPVRIDIESKKKVIFRGKKYTQQILSQKFRVSSTPTMIFLNADGEVLGTQPGFIRAEVLEELLTYVGTERFTEMEFKSYLEEQGVSVK